MSVARAAASDRTHSLPEVRRVEGRTIGPSNQTESYTVDGVWAAGDGLVITVDGEPVQRLRDCELRSSTHHTNKGEQHVEVSHHR